MFFWWFAHYSLPQREGFIPLANLHKEVEILSDWRDVPYIKARSEPDMYRAQGYWTASRRLFQIDMLRRIAEGRLAEVFGSSCLAQDKLIRQLGFWRQAKAELKSLDPEVLKTLEQYTSGINSFLNGKEYKNPLECSLLFYKPESWKPEDTLAIMKYMEYLTSESWGLDDLRQKAVDKAGPEIASEIFDQELVKSAFLAPDQSQQLQDKLIASRLHNLTIGQLIEKGLLSRPGFGSNGWVVSSAKSDSKGSMLALDRHTSFMDPNLFYVCTLSCPKMTVSGATICGVPGIMYGRNRSIAFGAVAFKADDQDLFVEQFSTEFPNKYKTPDGWKKVKTVVEEISIRGSLGFGEDKLLHKVKISRHGPILLSSGNSAICFNWIGARQKKTSLEAYWKLNRATNFEEFKDCLRDYEGSAQTFLYADKKGSVGLQVAGMLPERKGESASVKYRSSQLVPGWTGAYDWISSVPFEALPSSTDPQDGYLVANSMLFNNQPLNISTYPVKRVGGVLKAKLTGEKNIGLPDLAKLQGDEQAPLFKLVQETVKKSCTQKEVIDKFQLASLKILESWDGKLSSNSSAASIYESFLRTLVRRALVPKIGDALTRQYMSRWPRWTKFAERLLAKQDKKWLPPEERTFDSFVLTTFSQAILDVRIASESDDPKIWSWGNLHKASFNNLIFHGLGSLSSTLGELVNPPSIPLGGDGDTVSACNFSSYTKRNLFRSDLGPTTRILIDMSDNHKFYETQPLGQSAHLFSEYRLDQIDAWIKKKPLLVPFSDKESMKQQRGKVVLTP